MPNGGTEITYVQVFPERPVERFLQMVILSQRTVDELVLISPIIGPLSGVSVSMARLTDAINRGRIRTYVITNEPAPEYPAHQRAVSLLGSSDFTEIRFNPSLHAKVYVCRIRNGGFALLGSGNLTETSIRQRIEIGMIIFARGAGIPIFHELLEWGTVRLRSLRESKLVKRMTPRR
jgi:HKD family nuclease